MIKSIYLLISVLVVFGLPYHYSYKSQKLANTYAEGPFCWILPGADGPPLRGHVREMHLSLSPPNRLVFWGDIIKRTRRGIYTLPHFAVAIPTPRASGCQPTAWLELYRKRRLRFKRESQRLRNSLVPGRLRHPNREGIIMKRQKRCEKL